LLLGNSFAKMCFVLTIPVCKYRNQSECWTKWQQWVTSPDVRPWYQKWWPWTEKWPRSLLYFAEFGRFWGLLRKSGL